MDVRDVRQAISFLLDPSHETGDDDALRKAAAALPAGLLQLFVDENAHAAMMGNPVGRLRDSLAAQGGRVIDLFNKWDLNGDGVIEKSEFYAALPELGFASVSPAEVEELFNLFDADGSGTISFRELHKMLRKPMPDHRASKRKAAPSNHAHMLVDTAALRKETYRSLMAMGVREEMRNLTTVDSTTGQVKESMFRPRGSGMDAEF